MKAGWELKPLNTVVSLSKKKGGSRPLPYVGLEDIASGGTGSFFGSREPQSDKSTTFEFGSEHLLYGRLRPYLNKVMLPNFEGHCSSEIFPILPSPRLDRRFLFYWITGEETVEAIDATSTGARMPRANVSELLTFPIPLPPLEEQQRIVTILDEAFEGLSRAHAHAEANLQNARELFEAAREAVLDLEQTRELSFVQLERLIDIKHGFAFKSEFFAEEGSHVVLTPGNYFETGGYKDRGPKQKYYSGEVPRDYVLDVGDLLMAMTEQAPGLLGSCIIVPEPDRFLHNQRLGLIRPKGDVAWDAEFLFHVFNLKGFRQALSDSCTGATVRHTSPSRIQSVHVPYVDDVQMQRRIAEYLSNMADKTRQLESEYRDKILDIGNLRQSLLQKAFAGELT